MAKYIDSKGNQARHSSLNTVLARMEAESIAAEQKRLEAELTNLFASINKHVSRPKSGK